MITLISVIMLVLAMWWGNYLNDKRVKDALENINKAKDELGKNMDRQLSKEAKNREDFKDYLEECLKRIGK